MTLTLWTAFSLTGLFWVYVVVMRPRLPIPAERSIPQMVKNLEGPAQAAKAVQVAAEFLPDEAWLAAARYQIELIGSNSFIFANEWKPGDETNRDQIRVRPFAMVTQRHDAKGELKWMTLVSETALLQFSGDLVGKNPGRVVRAAMEGETRINGSDGLYMSGRTFYFEEAAQRIYSDAPLEFRIGNNRGRAGRVQMDLIPNEVTPIDRPNVWGLRTVRMSRNVAMDLEFRQGGKPFPLSINCSGGCEYDVEAMTATYDTGVRVYRKTGTAVDLMECDKLTVWFTGRKSAPPVDPAASVPDHQQINTDLKFTRLKAEGQPLTLRSDSQQLKAVLSTLVYDESNQVLSLTDDKDVRVTQKNNELNVPAITVLVSEAGGVSSIVCRGAGRLLAHSPDGEDAFTADWKKQLTKSTDPETGWDLIQLDEEASVLQPGRGFALGADEIRMWLTPMELANPFGITSAGAESSASAVPGSAEFPLPEPRRFTALGHVAIVSPMLEGEGRRLEVSFDAPPGSAGPLKLGRQSRPAPIQRVGLQEGPGSGLPAADEGMADFQEPLQVRADVIRVRMSPPAEDSKTPPHVAEIHTDGQVVISQVSEPGLPPLTLTGDRVQVTNEGADQQVLHVYGEPATIDDDRVHLEGRALHLSRASNRAWVEGAGLFRVPVDRDFEGKLLPEPTHLDVWWEREMDFDGRQAVFQGDVRAILDRTSMKCQTMRVTLDQRISFSEFDPEVAKVVSLGGIHCQEGVDFENKTYDVAGVLQELYQAHLWNLSVDRLKNATTAQGPGWVKRWSRAPSPNVATVEPNRVRANRPLRANTTSWTYLQVNFDNRMEGNLERQVSSFHDGVRVIYGPVSRPLDVLDEDHLPEDAGWLRCRQLVVEYVTPKKSAGSTQPAAKGFLYLTGRGNVDLEGYSFLAKSDLVTYDQSKDQYILKALGTGQVAVRREGGTNVFSQEYMIIPSERVFKAIGVSSAQGSQ